MALADDDPYFTDPLYNQRQALRRFRDDTDTEEDFMATAEEVMARLERGEDPELLKLVVKRAEERSISRLEALRQLLP